MRSRHRSFSAATAVAAIAGVVLLAAGWPLVLIAVRILSTWNQPLGPGTELLKEVGGVPWLIFRTALAALVIALAATLVALPVGWSLRRLPRMGLALAAVPLMLPSYLAYAAYTTLREGNHWIGRTLGGLPSDISANLTPVFAFGGLILWTWPVAALVLAVGFGRIPQITLDALHLDGANTARRWVTVLSMSRRSLASAIGLVTLLMLGSAVPLQLAQYQTYAIYVWKLLDLYVDQGVAWRVSLPLVGVLVIAAELVVRGVIRPESHETDREGVAATGKPLAPALASLLWISSVLIPIALFAYALRELSLLSRFWHDNGAVVAESALLAGVVGFIGAGLAFLTWLGLSTGRRRSATALRWCTRVMVLAGVLPGVMIGAATSRAWNAIGLWEWSGRGDGAILGVSIAHLILLTALVAGHVARLGFLGMLAGWVLWKSEPPTLRDLRISEAGSGFGAWWAAAAQPRIGVVAGVGLSCAALSFHEIEASVILQPPGTTSMARRLLEYLHYLKDQEVAAAGVNLMVGAVLVALLAGWLMSGVARRAGLET